MFGKKKSKETVTTVNSGLRLNGKKISKSAKRNKNLQDAKDARDFLKQKFDL